jgi:hypothetical protein
MDEPLQSITTIFGPYLNQRRKHAFVIRKYASGARQTIIYHRHLIELHLNRRLQPHERVTYLDGDHTNDHINNLRLLTPEETAALNEQEATIKTYTCPCGATFQRPAHVVRKNRKQGKQGPYCTHACAGRHNQKRKGA